MAFSSTPSDLVRVGLAKGDSGVVVAVMSNIAHANTSAIALSVGDAFAELAR